MFFTYQEDVALGIAVARADGERNVAEIRQNLEGKLIEVEEQKGRQIIVVETAEKTVKSLKENLRAQMVG